MRTKKGVETSKGIMFCKGLPRGDALCPKLLTLCLNPIACKMRATEGYRVSKPIGAKITDLLYVDDLKVSAASEGKLERVMRETRVAMEDVGLQWNKKKYALVYVKRGRLQESPDARYGEQELVKSLK